MSEKTALLLIEVINHIEGSLDRMIFVLILLVLGKITKTLTEWLG